ncbi:MULTISPECIES: hypothetical protein [Pantoea]|uniref:hypothetical protein n=1 Tax=Pantoea TaxID=53335 RepID=UPI000660CB08|nr:MULTISPECIES: hypothetical protein [Pantoea]MBS6436793.1 hypothetical protein [Pantoea sp.]MDU2730959.1 hypothetical protein [Pantoea sp.]DAL31225.1 MAG TPA_asm: hypothetical protein [Caudoviricetes sp.]
MKKYARIEKNTVQELFDTDRNIKEIFHPSMQWVDITEMKQQPSEDWRYDNEAFLPPLPLITI